MIYGVNQALGTAFAIPHRGTQDANFEIRNGSWVFTIVAWEGPETLEGDLSCTSVSRELTGGEIDITLTLSPEQCYNGPGDAPMVSFVSCADDGILGDGATINADCTSPGRSQSFRLSLYRRPPGAALDETQPGLVSACINDGDADNNDPVDSDLTLPPLSFLMGIPRVPVLVEAFDRPDCAGTPTQYPVVPRRTNPNRQIIQTNDRFFVAMVAPFCPQNFVLVEGNTALQTEDFCVMKYEAKEGSSGRDPNSESVPESSPDGVPWAMRSAYQAYASCRALSRPNFPGSFSLITNRQWMTIVYDLADVDANWVGGTAGSGSIFKGHTDAVPDNALEVDDPDDPYDQTGNSTMSGANQKRVFELASGEEIWDLAGNVGEWVDWGGDPQRLSTIADLNGGPPAVDTSPTWRGLDTRLAPLGMLDLMAPSSYGATEGFGRWLRSTGSVAVRGGAWMDEDATQSASDTGVAMLTFLTDGDASELYGFRCVYNPDSMVGFVGRTFVVGGKGVDDLEVGFAR